ncbi:MAG: Hsp70 family protein, partial [Phycisphaerales bacterium]|nr:Hsp70 family protein [Phycisphaerales bacterium]
EEDKKRRELVDLKNRADGTIAQVRKSLEEHGGKVSGEVRSKIESALSNLESKVKDENITKPALEAGLKELEEASMELGKIVYEQATAEHQASGGAAPSGGADDVIDADFEVKDD